MGDCLYHGSYGDHYCPECREEKRRGLEQCSIPVDPDIYRAKMESHAREVNLPLGLDPNGNPLKNK